MVKIAEKNKNTYNLPLSKAQIILDYRIAFKSRQASLLGRKEVLTGKAKFGIFGDGKEIAQVALAHSFKKGDFRSGYYRDQTWMLALGVTNVQQFFAQLYAHADLNADPSSAGRSMNSHFASRSLDSDGNWNRLTDMYNTVADISPTAGQIPRLVGLAYASKMFRNIPGLEKLDQFSMGGNEVAFGSIGNASCAEGLFWEAVNAVGVLQAPMVLSIWDDGYGISVPNEFQHTKANLSEMLAGFQRNKGERGYDIYTVNAWDYPALVETYQKATQIAREQHVPAIIHVQECTQPQGHSTSGSHERYKSKERLQWEIDFDGLAKMKSWMLAEKVATEAEFDGWEGEDAAEVKKLQQKAWSEYLTPIKNTVKEIRSVLEEISALDPGNSELAQLSSELAKIRSPFYRDIMLMCRKALVSIGKKGNPAKHKLIAFKKALQLQKEDDYNSYLYSDNGFSALKVEEVKPVYSDDAPQLNGFQIINKYFDIVLERDARVIAFGEDVGNIGDVNQGFAGLQEKYGSDRVSDTGIRECSIMGQAIGMSMRGLRPIAEIQYLDYVLYGLQILSDDLATLQYRTKGGQRAPAIIRTRGHRLEGIWHSGSHMGAVIHLLRGMHVCVPRNFVQAAGMYNTLLNAEEPAMVVEVLNGYRLKERMPDNIGEYTVPLGKVEVLREGSDVTIVTYGPLCRIADEAAEALAKLGIECEIIDVQTLLPFDLNHDIVESLKKTNRVLFLDEDVPGGASAFMMAEVLDKQEGYFYLDSKPAVLTAKPHRPAYGSDGDYWSKPNTENIIEKVYEMMNEFDPEGFPELF